MPGIPMALTVDARSLLLNRIPHLQLLVLFGSRARGDHDDQSDWDFAILYDCDTWKRSNREHIHNFLAIYTALSEIFEIPEDRIDLVDLDRASGLIAHYIARDGQLLYERHAGTFSDFQQRSLMSDEQLNQYHQKTQKSLEEFLVSQGL